MALQEECTVSVKATFFDEDTDNRWSEEQFGSDWNTATVEGEVRRVYQDGRVRVWFALDKTSYTFDPSHTTHDASTCPACAARSLMEVPLADLVGFGAPLPSGGGVGAVGGQPANALPRGGVPTEDAPPPPATEVAIAPRLGNPHPSNDAEDEQGGIESSGGEEGEVCADSATRRRRTPRRSAHLQIGELELSEDSDTSLPDLQDASSESSVSEDEAEAPAARGRGRVGRGRGRGRGQGRGGVRPRKRTRSLRGRDAEDATTVTRRGVVWRKGQGRQTCPHVQAGGNHTRPRLTLYNYTEKTPLDFFEHFLPSLNQDIARETTFAGRRLNLGANFEVTEGEIWLFLAYKHYMSVYPQDGDKADYWAAEPGPEHEGEVFIVHNLGKYGLTYSRYRQIERSFTLPTYEQLSDPFNPIRFFVDKWNENMFVAFIPGAEVTVDESMAEWLGKAMPGLMHVPRKPTDTGREGHTTACVESGLLIFYEIYEGKEKMEDKEYVREWGKNPAKAMRCVKNWFHSGRLVLVDSGFASVELAQGLAENGLFMIGNVKTAHAGFPKAWLNGQVTQRGDRAIASADLPLQDGSMVSLLAAADKDKQPMSLLGTAGTSGEGASKIRKFTTIRADGTYFVREASLHQMHIHERYRAGFNALDKHNAYRQGSSSFEGSWHTHRWWIREYSALLGMSEVNAWLAYRRFVPGQGSLSYSRFRRKLCYQLLNHPKHMEEEAMQTRSMAYTEGEHHKVLALGKGPSGAQLQRQCSFCTSRTKFYCSCTPMEGPGGRGIYFCCIRTNPQCYQKHRDGVKPNNKRAEGQKARWAKLKANHDGSTSGTANTSGVPGTSRDA